jgi:hypothetical protein
LGYRSGRRGIGGGKKFHHSTEDSRYTSDARDGYPSLGIILHRLKIWFAEWGGEGEGRRGDGAVEEDVGTACEEDYCTVRGE